MDRYESAKKAIQDLFSDTSVSAEETLENLQSLKDEIDIYLEAIAADLAAKEK